MPEISDLTQRASHEVRRRPERCSECSDAMHRRDFCLAVVKRSSCSSCGSVKWHSPQDFCIEQDDLRLLT